jgi:murein DD-endopeptidase MepM/ murein hydrolase activator NlpD
VEGAPENTGQDRAVPITLDTVTGNSIFLDLGGGRYAFYAHLQPGSVQAKAGDHVKRGDVLGKLGHSGNSTAPHLHFHVCTAAEGLECEGVPYVFDRFTGTHATMAGALDDAMDFAERQDRPPTPVTGALPGPDTLVTF